MSASGPRSYRARGRDRQRRSSTGRRILGWIVRLALIAIVFVAGLAVGRALESAPNPGGSQTIVRTLEPVTIQPRERTVTVTTSER